MKIKSLLIIGVALMLAAAGCKSTNPQTGQKEFDPARTEQIKAAVEVPARSAIRRVIQNNPEHADEIVRYARYVGAVFCDMKSTGQFDPATLVAQLDAIAVPYIEDDVLIDVKNSAISIYRIAYADRFRAELPPDQWVYNLADVFCESIDGALRDAGYPGSR